MTADTPPARPLLYGFDRDGEATRTLDWDTVRSGPAEPAGGLRWIHLNRLDSDVKAWAETTSGVDPDIVEALFREDTRPRAVRSGKGWLVNLRGVNLNPGPQADTMIALRMWVTPRLVMTLRAYKIRAAEDLSKAFEAGTAPSSTGGLVTFLADRLTQRLDQVVSNLGDGIDELEERLLEGDTTILKTDLAKLRRQAVAIRRYMAPQKDAFHSLAHEPSGPMSDEDRRDMKEVLDALARVTEDLEAARDRAQLVQDQITERRGEEMNQRLFILAIISAIFLPLSFITGLFGVNVGGMPGVESPIAFAALCGGLALGSVGLIALFKRIGWM